MTSPFEFLFTPLPPPFGAFIVVCATLLQPVFALSVVECVNTRAMWCEWIEDLGVQRNNFVCVDVRVCGCACIQSQTNRNLLHLVIFEV